MAIDWNSFTSEPNTPSQSAQPTSIDWNQFTPQESNLESFNRNVSDPIIAFGQGVDSTLEDFTGDVGGLMTQAIGHMSPALEQRLNEIGNNTKQFLDRGQDQNINTSHPILNALGKGVGYTAGLVGTGAILPSSGVSGAISQGLLGSAMAGPGNRTAGFVGGVAVPAVANAVGSVGNFFSANAREGKEIQNLVNSINSAPSEYKNMDVYGATKKAFEQFRETSGDINTKTAQSAISDYMSKYEDSLTSGQKTALKNSISDLSNAKTLEDVHNARKDFSSDLSQKFLRGNDELNGNMRRELLGVQKSFEANLKSNASNLGVLDKYNEANGLYKQSKEADIINKAFNDTKLPQGGNNFLAFNRSLMKLKADKANQLSAATKESISGIQQTLKEANHILGMDMSSNIHIGMANLAVSAIKTMAKIPVMKQALQYAGTPQGRYLANAIAKSAINYSYSKVVAPVLQQRFNSLVGDDE